MVAVIHSSSSLRNALNYNEQKVKQKHANCLMAVNYPKEVMDLTFYQKLNRLTNQAALNTRAKVNSVHISLNFDTPEKIPRETLQEIASTYMEKIGFGKQPYLVYEHTDAGHPHLHIVTTNIKADGKRIELHNLGRNQSEKARKEIELSFGLVQAENKQLKQVHELKPLNAQKLQYGKSDTRRAITNVLDVVLNKYKYTSLPELNAVLKLYNVVADQGSEDSRTYKHKGLVYRILDEQGNKVGVPIKASLIYSKPILSYIEGKFQQNETERQPHRQRLKTAIDWALLKPNQSSLPTFIKALEKESIHTVLRQNKEGIIYGITYIDHKTKCVFNGSDLGKPYSAKGILERCNQANTQQQAQGIGLQTLPTAKEGKNIRPVNNNTFQSTTNETDKILDSLVSPTTVYDGLPAELKTTKKKKKRKRISI